MNIHCQAVGLQTILEKYWSTIERLGSRLTQEICDNESRQTEIEHLQRELGETNEALAACQSQASGEIEHLRRELAAANKHVEVLQSMARGGEG